MVGECVNQRERECDGKPRRPRQVKEEPLGDVRAHFPTQRLRVNCSSVRRADAPFGVDHQGLDQLPCATSQRSEVHLYLRSQIILASDVTGEV